jgi:biopolymer transport protein ExbB
MLTELLLDVLLLGAEWVLYVLLALSILSFAVMIERLIFFANNAAAHERLVAQVMPLLRAGERDRAWTLLASWQGSEAEVLRAGLEGARRDRVAAEKLVHAALVTEQNRMERRLSILGSLGSNAPFVGLFGTVLGIIRAFHDLSLDVKGGATQVMSGVSEALVATAVGLFVAIPAVAAYNYFMRRVARSLAQAQSAADTLIAYSPEGERDGTR